MLGFAEHRVVEASRSPMNKENHVLTQSLQGVIDVHVALLVDICDGRVIGQQGSEARDAMRNEEQEVPTGDQNQCV